MAGGGTSTTTQLQQQSPELRSFVAGTLPYLQQAQQMLPIGAFTQPQVPQIAGLSPTQQWATAQAPTLGNIQAPEVSGLEQLAQLTSGQIGQSPLTQAGLQGWEATMRPSIENTLATMGLGRSGAGANILEQSRAQVLGPLIQQEIQQRQAAVPQLFGLGQQLAGRQSGAAQFGLQAGGLEQGTAQAALDAAQRDLSRRQQLSERLFLGVPQSTGTATTSTSPQQNFWGK